jgi:hypothetical protein
MRLQRFITVAAATLLLGVALSTAASANCGKAGQYCNGDPNHSALQQLKHAAKGFSQAAETFDGSRSK